MDTDVSEEHAASISNVEACRVSSYLGDYRQVTKFSPFLTNGYRVKKTNYCGPKKGRFSKP
jgi:hypothetical protein